MLVVPGGLRWKYRMGNLHKLLSALSLPWEAGWTLGRGASTKLPKKSGPDFTLRLRAVTLCDLAHAQFIYMTGHSKSIPLAKTLLLRSRPRPEQVLSAFLHPCHCHL